MGTHARALFRAPGRVIFYGNTRNENEIDGATDYAEGLNGNEMAWLLDDISEMAEQRLQSGEGCF